MVLDWDCPPILLLILRVDILLLPSYQVHPKWLAQFTTHYLVTDTTTPSPLVKFGSGRMEELRKRETSLTYSDYPAQNSYGTNREPLPSTNKRSPAWPTNMSNITNWWYFFSREWESLFENVDFLLRERRAVQGNSRPTDPLFASSDIIGDRIHYTYPCITGHRGLFTTQDTYKDTSQGIFSRTQRGAIFLCTVRLHTT